MNQTEFPENNSLAGRCGSLSCRTTLIAKYIGVTNSFMIVPTSAANAVVIAAILTTSSLRTPSYLLLASLAFSDFVTGFVIQPLCTGLAFWIGYMHTVPYHLTGAILVINGFLNISAGFITTAISVDRYLAIRLKIRYRSVVTIPRTRHLLLLVYVASGVSLLFMNLSGLLVATVFFIILVTTCLIVIVVSYTMSFRALKIHCAQIHPQGNHQPNSTTQSNAIDVLKYRKLLKTMIIIVLVIVLFFLIFYAAVSMSLKKVDGYLMLNWILLSMSQLNSIINPLICIVRMRDLRQASRDVLRRSLFACLK